MIEETGWLIELQGEPSPTWWGRVDNEDGVNGWTTDHAKAIRFARAQDAQAIIDEVGWTRAIPTDHMWCDYSHKWIDRMGMTMCSECLVVKRADDKNGPCHGPGKLRPMEGSVPFPRNPRADSRGGVGMAAPKNKEERDLCAAVDNFAEEMKRKLIRKARQGYHGWKNIQPTKAAEKFWEHLGKGDPIDLANFLMMLHRRGYSVALHFEAQLYTRQRDLNEPIEPPVSTSISNGDRR